MKKTAEKKEIMECQRTFMGIMSLLNAGLSIDDFFEKSAKIIHDNPSIGDKIGILLSLNIYSFKKEFSSRLSEDEITQIIKCVNEEKDTKKSEENNLLIIHICGNSSWLAIKPKDINYIFPEEKINLFHAFAELIKNKTEMLRKDMIIAAEDEANESIKKLEKFFFSFPNLPTDICSRTILDETRRLTLCEIAYAVIIGKDNILLSEVYSASSPILAEMAKEQAKKMLKGLSTSEESLTSETEGMLKKYIAVPIVYCGTPAGMLMLANYEKDFTPGNLRMIKRMSHIYSQVISYKAEMSRQMLQNKEKSSLLNASWDLIFTFNAHGIITYMSPLVKKTGYSVKETEGHNIKEFLPEDEINRFNEKMENLLSIGKESPSFVCRILKKDGTEMLTQMKLIVNKTSDGLLSVSAILKDITEDIKKQQELDQTNLFYKTIFSKSPLPILITDPDSGKILRANKSAENFLNLNKKEITKYNILSFHPKEERKNIEKTLEKIKAKSISKESFTITKKSTLKLADKEISVRLAMTLINLPEQEQIMLVIIEDLSTEEQHQKETAFGLDILNNAPDMLFAIDLKSRKLLFANKAFCKLSGIPEKEIIGKNILEIFGKNEEANTKIYNALNNPNTHINIPFSDKNGNETELEIFSSETYFNDDKIAIVAGREIKALRTLSNELLKTNAKLSAILSFLPDHVQLLDKEKRITYDNMESGNSSKSLIFHKGISYQLGKYLEEAVQKGMPLTFMEDLPAENGKKRNFEHRIIPVNDPAGNVSATAIITRDYSEMNEKYEKILAMEFILDHIFENSKDFIFVVDKEDRFLMINNAAAERYGKTVEEMKGKTVFELGITKNIKTSKEIKAIFENKTARFLTRTKKYPTGTFYESLSCSPVFNPMGEVSGVVVVGRDLTKEHEQTTDEALAAAKEIVSMKMRPIGHDFNNILTVITGYATLLSETVKDDTRVIAALRQILKATERAAKLTASFQSYARNPVLKKNKEDEGHKP